MSSTQSLKAGLIPDRIYLSRLCKLGVKTTESGGISGYDAGKKVKGRKRHILRNI